MLTFDTPLTTKPRRILVAGVIGVGKTTMAGRIALISGSPHTEIDALFHGPEWTPRPSFLDDVRELVAQEAWTTEWQYSSARAMLADNADLLVWLDLPFWRVTFPRVVRRTAHRRWRRIELWNGNVEPAMRTVLTDPGHIVRWAVRTRNIYASRVADLQARLPELTVVRLRSPSDVEHWLAVRLTQAFDV